MPHPDSAIHAFVLRVSPLALLLAATLNGAQAATLQTRVTFFGSRCQIGGDPTCAGGTSFSPAGGLDSDTLSNAEAGSTVQSGLAYIDPAIGTANSLNGVAIAGPGFMQLTANASVSSTPALGTGTPSLNRLSAQAQGTIIDRLSIAAATAGLQGASATVNGSFVVEGLLDTGAVNFNAGGGSLAAANWRIEFGVANAFGGSITSFVPGFFGSQSVSAGGVFAQGPASPVTIPVSFNIQFGVPFDVRFSAAVVAQATMSSASAKPLSEGVSAASAAALFGNTIFWNGISNITSGGQTITGYTVTSLSGADYAGSLQPIPLPASAWLLLSGVGALAWRRR